MGSTMQIPDYCEPLIGYRVWRVAKGGLLTGVHVCEPWAPKHAHRATCQTSGQRYWGEPPDRNTPHMVDGAFVAAPAMDCTCGIWAKRTADDVHAAASADDAPYFKGYAWGEVWLWGRAIEHTDGWRAEYAYPKTLKATSDAREIAALYGIACEPVKVQKRETPDISDYFYYLSPKTLMPAYAPVFSPPPKSKPTKKPAVIEAATADDVQSELDKQKKQKKEQQDAWRQFLGSHPKTKSNRSRVFLSGKEWRV